MNNSNSIGAEPDQGEHNKAPKEPARKRRLWPWFAIGFLVVFVGMSLFVKTHYMHASGRAIVSCKLWEYYAVEIPRVTGSTTMGPASGNQSAVFRTAIEHILYSTAGGAVMLGIGWGVRKIRDGRRENKPPLMR